MQGIHIPQQRIELDPTKEHQSGHIDVPITPAQAEQIKRGEVPTISNMSDLFPGATIQVNRPKHPLSTSTNKDRKAKKAKRQNRKKGRR